MARLPTLHIPRTGWSGPPCRMPPYPFGFSTNGERQAHKSPRKKAIGRCKTPMTKSTDNGGPKRIQWLVPLPLHRSDSSYAADWSTPGTFCFGLDSGAILITDVDGQKINEGPGSHSGDAVNGIARIPGTVAISTRSDITLWQHQDSQPSILPYGAHEVIATKNGYFVAPAGLEGVILLKPAGGSGTLTAQGFNTPGNANFRFYRALSLCRDRGSEVLAFAGRRGGIGAIRLPEPLARTTVSEIVFDDQDIVDICSLGADSLAIAAVTTENTLFFLRNVLVPENTPLTFSRVEGRAYKLLCSRGHLILLTSKALYVFLGIAKRFVDGHDLTKKGETQVYKFPLEAVDASLCRDEWLLLIMPDRVLKADLTLLPADAGSIGIEGPQPVCTTDEPSVSFMSSTALDVRTRHETQELVSV